MPAADSPPSPSSPSRRPAAAPAATGAGARRRAAGRIVAAFALAAAGGALLHVPAHYYQITRRPCSILPDLSGHLLGSAGYVVAVALLGIGWVLFLRETAPDGGVDGRRRGGSLSLRAVLLIGAALHLVAATALPFLSWDPIYYAAIGRASQVYHGAATQPLCSVLPPGDPFFTVLPERWRCGTSPYGPGFVRLSTVIAWLGGDNLTLHFRLYQLCGMLALLATAWLVAEAVRGTDPEGAADRGPHAAVMVLLSPLAILEGTQSAHNDALLALGAAAFAFAVSRRRPLLAGLCLLGGLLIKASALMLFAFYALREAIRSTRRLLGGRLWPLFGLLGVVGGGLVPFLLWPLLRSGYASVIVLIGRPDDEICYCLRSWECLPRAILHWALGWRAASWAVGLLFRLLAAGWLCYAAARSASEYAGPSPRARSRQLLGWAASFLFVYYFFLHGWMQSWYFLPAIALLPFLPRSQRRAAVVLCVTAVAYYMLDVPFDCYYSYERMVMIGVTQVLQGMIVLFPPAGVLLYDFLRRRGRRRALP